MAEYQILLELTGHVSVTVEADSVEDALDRNLDEWKLDFDVGDIEEALPINVHHNNEEVWSI